MLEVTAQRYYTVLNAGNAKKKNLLRFCESKNPEDLNFQISDWFGEVAKFPRDRGSPGHMEATEVVSIFRVQLYILVFTHWSSTWF